MSKFTRVREWMNGSVCAEVKFLYEKLPAHMVEHSLDLLEAYDRDYSPKHTLNPEYLNRVASMLIGFAKGEQRSMTTSKDDSYNLIHELNIYLDGFLFQIDIKENTDIEKDKYFMYALPKS